MRTSSQIANLRSSLNVRCERLGPAKNVCEHQPMFEKLREIRKARGLTGEALADMVGTSKGYISEIETGKRVPSTKMQQQLAEALGLSVYEISGVTDLPEDILSHLSVMRALSEEDRRAVERHAAGLLDKARAP
jgi:transcriptional regulator with XRE-family HTH domain